MVTSIFSSEAAGAAGAEAAGLDSAGAEGSSLAPQAAREKVIAIASIAARNFFIMDSPLLSKFTAVQHTADPIVDFVCALHTKSLSTIDYTCTLSQIIEEKVHFLEI
jgi:hypothetical protein